MAGHDPGLIKNYTAAAAIPAYTIATLGSADGTVAIAASAAAQSIGVTTDIAADLNERCDVVRSGLSNVRYGGTVTRGALLTADAQGRAVVTTTANDRYIGIAEVAGVVGDIGVVFICPGIV